MRARTTNQEKGNVTLIRMITKNKLTKKCNMEVRY